MSIFSPSDLIQINSSKKCNSCEVTPSVTWTHTHAHTHTHTHIYIGLGSTLSNVASLNIF